MIRKIIHFLWFGYVIFMLLAAVFMIGRDAVTKFDWNFLKGEPSYVYITPTGECYHDRDCYTIDKSEHIAATTESEAVERGYRPCEVCNP